MTTWHVHTCPGCTNRLAAATTDLLARMVAVHNGICVPLGWNAARTDAGGGGTVTAGGRLQAVATTCLAEHDARAELAEAAQAQDTTPSGALTAADKRALPGRIDQAIAKAQAAARAHDAAIRAYRAGQHA